MYNDALKLVLEVLVGHDTVHQQDLVRVEIIHGQVLIVHLFDQVLPRDVLLRVRLHVEFHREAAIVVYLVLLHRIEVEFESLQLQEQDVGQTLNGASLESVSLGLTPLAVVSVVTL